MLGMLTLAAQIDNGLHPQAAQADPASSGGLAAPIYVSVDLMEVGDALGYRIRRAVRN